VKITDYSPINATIKWLRRDLGRDLESPPLVCDVNNDGSQEVIVAGRTVDNKCNVWAFDLETGSIVWHTILPEIPILPALSTSDLNGDGFLDILVRTENKIFILNGSDGSVEFTLSTTAYSVAPFIDINNDGFREIVVAETHRLVVFSGLDGSVLWSFRLDGRFGAFAFADVDGNGLWEIIVAYDSNGSHPFTLPDTLLVFSSDGRLLRGINLGLKGGDYIISEPLIVDVNGDGLLDVVLSSIYNCLAVDLFSGRVLWRLNYLDCLDEVSRTYVTWTFGVFPSIGDINSDGELEILIASRFLMFIISSDGELSYYAMLPESNFLYEGFGAIGDVDGDNRCEIVIGGITTIWIFDWDDKRFYSIPIGWEQNAKPATLVDIDGDSDVDILVAGQDRLYAFDLLSSGFRIDFPFPSINGSYIGNYMLIDPDLDGLSTYSEKLVGTDPYSYDSDGDGYNDGYEVANNMNPLKFDERPPSPPPKSPISLYLQIATIVGVSTIGLIVVIAYIRSKKKLSKHLMS